MNALSTDETSVPQFYIAAGPALQERRTLTLKHADTFTIFDHCGDMSADTGSSTSDITRVHCPRLTSIG